MASIKEKAKVRGTLQIKAYQAIGDDEEELIRDELLENLVVNGGLAAIASLVGAATSGKNVNRIHFGTNGSDPLLSDTEVEDAVEKAVLAITYPADGQVQFTFDLGLEEGNGTSIREYGLICADDTLFSRKTSSLIEKTDQIRLEITWTLTFTS